MEPETLTLTTAHSASSYGRPVLVIDGDAYGPGDFFEGTQAADLVRQWAARFEEPPDSQLLTDWRAAGERVATTDDDLPPELTEAQLAEIARTWPWNVKDALSLFVSRAMTEAGIASRTQRQHVLRRMGMLTGEIDE